MNHLEKWSHGDVEGLTSFPVALACLPTTSGCEPCSYDDGDGGDTFSTLVHVKKGGDFLSPKSHGNYSCYFWHHKGHCLKDQPPITC